MKIVNDLLRIKTHREQQAETALSQASRALRAAEKAVANAEEKLKRTHSEFDAKKRALYDDLFSRLVHRADLDLARSKLEKIDATVKECETELHTTREKLALAEREREDRRIQFRDASRIREKYAELSLQVKNSLAQVQIKKEEMELEEVMSKHEDGGASDMTMHVERAV